MKKDDFLKVQNEIIIELKKLDNKSLIMSIGRFISGILVIILLLMGYFIGNNIYSILSLVCLIVFLILVYYHNLISSKLSYLKAKQEVISRYLKRFNNTWYEFSDTGSDLVESKGIVKDLDIVGDNSLYQYLNTASTYLGKKSLVNKLTKTTYDFESIKLIQNSVKELSLKDDFVLKYETYGRLLKQKDNKVYDLKDCKNVFKVLRIILPIITVVSIFLFCFNIAFKLSIILMPIGIFGQWIISGYGIINNKEIFDAISDLSKNLKQYYQMTNLVISEEFDSKYLLDIKDNLIVANKALKKLDKIASMFKQRNNLLAFLLLNGLFMYDVNCLVLYQKWVDNYGLLINSWLHDIGEIESLNSLQVLTHTKERYSYPSIIDDNCPSLQFKQAYHPLINGKDVVANDFMMDKQVCVITGSNMSGKTTFLRTVGINLVLAYAGGVVMADCFSCSLMRIYTSMRIEDDIRGVSSFYGELLRIKDIVEANRQGELMIALIDEIFKGTNSRDRIIGAKETVKQLSSSNIFTFITTHDFELCDLENEVSCQNYHFTESYRDNKIIFDYLIKDGRCKTTNAQYLLKMVGIIK